MGNESFTPAPAPPVTPRMPYPPPSEAARQAAVAVGAAYGKFDALSETFCDTFLKPQTDLGGLVLWDRMSKDDQLKTIGVVQAAYNNLPPLPPATNPTMAAAVRDGFSQGANASYQNERFKARALWVASELAKAAIFAIAAGPVGVGTVTVRGVGSAFTTRFSDCAAQTASRIVIELTGVQVDAAFFVRRFGLPRATISSYDSAVAYARNWFEQVGIKLSPKSGGFFPASGGGVEGHYAIFLRGGGTGGHVVYGRVTPSAATVIDNQLGKSWASLELAQRELGMQATAAYRVESATVP